MYVCMYVAREFGTDACINAMQMFHFSPPRVNYHKYIIFASVCQAAVQIKQRRVFTRLPRVVLKHATYSSTTRDRLV